jgi:hypothetical protein
VAIKDSVDRWVRDKPVPAMVSIVIAGLVVGGLVGLGAGYKIEQNRVASGVNRLKAQVNLAHRTKPKTTTPAVKRFSLSTERIGSVTTIGTNTIGLRTKRLGLVQLQTTNATQFEKVTSGSQSAITVGSRAVLTIGGDILVVSSGSLLGRPITKAAHSSFTLGKANATGPTTTVAFSKLKVIDVVSTATRSDIKQASELMVGGHAPSTGSFTAVEVIVLPAGSGFAK